MLYVFLWACSMLAVISLLAACAARRKVQAVIAAVKLRLGIDLWED